jgi:hypothetical protein
MHRNTTNDKSQITASYKTYSWLDFNQTTGGITANASTYTNEFFYFYNELTDKYIRDAVDNEMKLYNLHVSTNETSLQVRYHIVTNNLDSFNYAFSGKDTALLHTINPNHASATAGTDEKGFSKGTLIIELVDVKTSALTWRGWSSAAFDHNSKESTKETIQKAVGKIFHDFPLKVMAKN